MLPATAPETPSAPPSAAAGGPVQSVGRALRILAAFERPDDVTSVGAQARALGVHKSTASRLMATLASSGFLERVAEDGYRPGPELSRLGRVAAPRTLSDVARPAMDDLAAETGETITLAVATGGAATTVAQTDSRYVVGAQSWVGRRSPLHVTSDGKVLLAFGAASLPVRRPGGPPPSSAEGDVLRRELDDVRAFGWAQTTGDFEPGLHGVATPVFAASGACCAALCVSGPAYRLEAERLPEVAARCAAAAQRVTAALAAEAEPVLARPAPSARPGAPR